MPEARRATQRERALADQILAREAGADQSPEALAVALDRALDRLDRRLSGLIGQEGFVALLKRALHLSKGESPFLGPVAVVRTPDDVALDGLVASARGQDPALARQGLVEVLANLIWLLVTFIGPGLGLRLVHEAFPDSAPGAPGPGEGER